MKPNANAKTKKPSKKHKAKRTRDAEAEAWKSFRERRPGFGLTKEEPLYSLDPTLIDLIQKNCASFFTPKELAFEHDLARTVNVAFWRGRAIGEIRSDPKLDASIQKTSQAIKQMLLHEYSERGVPIPTLRNGSEKREEYQSRAEDRKQGYQGWLINHPPFWDEVGKLRSKWGTEIGEVGFPRLGLWLTHEPENVWTDECRLVFVVFYQRWCLQTMTTWDLPVPIRHDLGVGIQDGWDNLRSSGIVAFIPWYLVTGEKIDFADALRTYRETHLPAHLQAWADKGTKGRRKPGDKSHQQLFVLHRYLTLVIWRRYAERSRRQAQKIDLAFAEYLGLKDSKQITQLRQNLHFQPDLPKAKTIRDARNP